MINLTEIKIDTKFIKLQQALKLANLISQGSDAKEIILDGMVSINGEVVFQRGKKVFDGDIIEVSGLGKIIVRN